MESPVEGTHRLAPYLFLCATFFLIGIFYDTTALALSVVLTSVAVVMKHYAHLSAVSIARSTTSVRVDAKTESEDVVVEFEIRNTTRIPVVLGEYSLQYSSLLRISDTPRAGILVLPPLGAARLAFRFSGRAGTYRVGPLRVLVRDPLGLFRSKELEVRGEVEVKVLPRVEYAVVRKLWVTTRKSGLVKTKLPGEGVEIYDIRDYRPGDELRYVVWRVFASRGVIAVKEMEKESYQYVMFIVDSTRDMWVGPVRQTPVEHFSRVVASIAYYLCSRGYSVSTVVFNERKISSSGKPFGGLKGVRATYRVLSDVEYVESEEGRRREVSEVYGGVLEKVVALLPRERALVFLFSRPTGEVRERSINQFSNALRARGHVFFLVTPIVVKYEMADMPGWAQKLYQLKLYEVLREDLDSVKRLRSSGVRVIAVTPAYIPQRVVQVVEQYM
ncbi:MAG: DUF58 domain-containing protein [Sulfolobales archaeon]|nr:DUF58 domain-containing protein [Sulfolobales archaeon]